jgi:hypothetical protein
MPGYFNRLDNAPMVIVFTAQNVNVKCYSGRNCEGVENVGNHLRR